MVELAFQFVRDTKRGEFVKTKPPTCIIYKYLYVLCEYVLLSLKDIHDFKQFVLKFQQQRNAIQELLLESL